MERIELKLGSRNDSVILSGAALGESRHMATREVADVLICLDVESDKITIWPRPTPVTERFPEHKPYPNNVRVLAFVPEQNGKYGVWFSARYDGSDQGCWYHDDRSEEIMPTPSHWMTIPPKP